MLAGSIFQKNRKGLPVKDDSLNIPRGCERGTFKNISNFRFHLVATQWKYSKTLQLIISLVKLEKQKSPDGEVKK